MSSTGNKQQLLLRNGRIWQGRGHRLASWMLVNRETGIITALGAEEPPAMQHCDVTDLQDKLVLPGFHEAHIHVSSLGKVLCGANLEHCKTIKEVLQLIKDFSAARPKASFIVAYNLNDVITGRLPTKDELDSISPDKPAMVYRVCIHIAAINSKFFSLLEWNESTPDPDGGVIERYGPSHANEGQLTGCVKESALVMAEKIIAWTMEERLQHIRTGLEFCLRHGVTSVHSNEPAMWHEYCTLADKDELPIRVFLAAYYGLRHEGSFPLRPGHYNEYLSCDRVKLFTDGSLGAFTAGLSQPYVGTSSKGILIYTQDEFNRLVHEATAEGYRMEIHAIGDAAADIALNALDQVGVAPEKRPILTHCQILREDQIQRMKKLRVVANIQPQMLVTDYQWLTQRVPSSLLHFAYAWKSLKSHGIVCAGGSDAPVEHATPLVGMYDAVFRRVGERSSPESLQYKKEECYSMSEAIELYTAGGAWAAMREQDLGKLQLGYKADFVVLDSPGDLLTSPHLLLQTTVSQVWINGLQKV